MKSFVIAGAVFISLQQGAMQRYSLSFNVKMIPCKCQMHDKACTGCKKICLPMVCSLQSQYGKKVTLHHVEQEILLNHIVIVEFGPLKDVLLTHNVWVDEQVAVTHAEVLLAGGTLEALQMVNLVPHTHCHLKCSNPLLTRSTETVLTEKPEWMRRYQHNTEKEIENMKL